MTTHIQRIFYALLTLTASILSTGCEKESIPDTNHPEAVKEFLTAVQANPLMIDGVNLGDSWRLIREKGAYNDGEYRKEFDIDLLSDADSRNYKEYWVFGREKVLLNYCGSRYDKKWDGFYQLFDHRLDLENKLLSIDYVYEEEGKAYIRDFTITSLTATELVLTEERQKEAYFYQYTFRREKL